MNFVTPIFTAISALFNYITGRSNASNASDVKDAQKGKNDAAAVDKTNEAIDKRDANEIRKEFAE